MSSAPNWSQLPAELCQFPQWVVSRGTNDDKGPLALGSNGFYNASVTDPKTWTTFHNAATAAWPNHMHIGFILSNNDPYTCIDLDVKDVTTHPNKPELWTKPEDMDRYWKLINFFDSYTESSRSGKGFHIWVRGKIAQGRRRSGVEIYSNERFIICTGNVIVDKPIAYRQEQLEYILLEMGLEAEKKDNAKLEELDAPQVEDDWAILDMACNANNGQKFWDLYQGKWQALGFPSQSEADLALMSMFTFYSKNNEQCRRMFRDSALGKREKAVKDNRYLNFTLLTIRIRQKNEVLVDVSELLESEKFKEQTRKEAIIQIQQANAAAYEEQRIPNPLHQPGHRDDVPSIAPPTVNAALAGPVPAAIAEIGDSGLPWPPGGMGVIAQYIYRSSPRPVKEIATVAALGLIAGMCGKAYHIPQSGLNVYIILIARSGVGKEAMHSGLASLCKSAVMRCPAIMDFVNFSDFASGPALVKASVAKPSFVNVAGEWGRKLKSIASLDGRDGPLATLRTVMTNLYQKSGPQAVVGGITYSNKEQSVQSVSGVAFSMIGETTPGTFYDSLTQTMMEDGFLSRFIIVEYDGPRPALNAQQYVEPEKVLAEMIGDIGQHSLKMMGRDESIPVGRTEESARILNAFELECDTEINNNKDEAWRQMWNRASLKVMRISGLLAVADNWLRPVIEARHVEWAIDLIRRDMAVMSRRLEEGDVGMSDSSRERKIINIAREYLAVGAQASYAIPEKMMAQGVIPKKYFQMRIAGVNSFVSHKMGATAALDITIKSMIDSGYIAEVEKSKCVEQFAFHGKAYRILSLPKQHRH